MDPGPDHPVDPKPRQGSAHGTPESFPPADLDPNPITSLGNLLSTTGSDGHVGRTLVFLWEHGQDGDTFVVPDVLRPYTGFDTVTR